MNFFEFKKHLFIFFILILFSFGFFSIAQENKTSNSNIFLDSDQDGLSNDEEIMFGTNPNNSDTDGDGYSDGAEVKSGYDPNKPAPNDKLDEIGKVAGTSTTNEENLTETIANELAKNITDPSKPKELGMTDINYLMDEYIDKSISFDDLPNIDTNKIKIKDQAYTDLSEEEKAVKKKDDSLEYLVSVAYIAANNSPSKLSDPGDLEKLTNEIVMNANVTGNLTDNLPFFEKLSKKSSDAMNEMEKIEVPSELLEFHVKGIKIIKYASQIKEDIKQSSKNNDPMSNIINMSKLQSLSSLGLELLNDTDLKLKEQGIENIPLEL